MYLYKIYGLYIESEYFFEEAWEVKEVPEGEEISMVIKKGHLPDNITKITEEDDHIPETGFLHKYVNPMELWIRAKSCGAFKVLKGREIIYQLYEKCDYLMLNQMFLCAVIPSAYQMLGMVGIHGSGILLGNAGIILSGDSGAGKSTLTQGLLGQDGIFMADDTVTIRVHDGKVMSQAAYPQQKICVDSLQKIKATVREKVLLPPDEDREKYAVRLADGFTMEEQELKAIFILSAADVEEVTMQQIKGAEKLNYLIRNIYRNMELYEKGMAPEMFQQCVEICNKVEIFTITRPATGPMTTDMQMALVRGALGMIG